VYIVLVKQVIGVLPENQVSPNGGGRMALAEWK